MDLVGLTGKSRFRLTVNPVEEAPNLSHVVLLCIEYTGTFLADNYITNIAMLNLLRKHEYLFTGHISYASYMKDEGPMDSLLVYMNL